MRTLKAAFWMPNLCSSFSSFSFSLQGSHGLILSIPLFLNCIHTASFWGGFGPPYTFYQFLFPVPARTISVRPLSLSIYSTQHAPSFWCARSWSYPLSRTKQNTSKMLYSARIWYGFFFIYTTFAAGYSAAACWFRWWPSRERRVHMVIFIYVHVFFV